MFDLELIGAGEFRRRPLDDFVGAELARVSCVYGEEFDVLSGGGMLRAECAGMVLYGAPRPSDLPVTGDWVVVRTLGCGRGLITAVLPRRTCLSRRAAGKENVEQPLAANVDVAMIVCPLDVAYNSAKVDRYLTLAAQAGVEPILILTKADVDLESAPVPSAIRVSAVTGEGVDDVRARVSPNRTAVLLGPSGAGKSTLINALLGEAVQDTAPVREGDRKGRHTTTRRDLVPLPGGGALIDTPGLREIQLWADSDAVDEVFADITLIAERCRFGDCRHAGEPGCAIADAIADGRLAPERLRSWQKLRREAKRHETDIAETLANQRRIRAIHRAMRARYKARE